MGLATAHGLGQVKNRIAGRTIGQMPESPVDECLHTVGQVVLQEELLAVDRAIEEIVQVQDGSATILLEH